MQSSDPSYTAPPFPAFPCTSRYIPLGTVEEAFSPVCRSIDARETISLIIGPPGTGKSLICRLLAERYSHDFDVVVLGETPIESRTELLSHLLHQLRLDSSGQDPQLALIDYLSSEESAAGGLLILIDKAQSLSAEIIESIRMVTNILHDGEPRVVAVLCGGMKLDETLIDSSMEAFTQRIATRCYLHPMNAEETRQYICDTIQSCGSEPHETIVDEAISAVHHACNGVPRLINQMLTQAIDCAAESDEILISEQIIDRAWAQLQQLPSPMVEEPKIATDASPIEFGELEDTIEDDSTTEPQSVDFAQTEQVAPEQVAPEQVAPEQVAPEQVAPELVNSEQLATHDSCGGCGLGCHDDEMVAIETIDELNLNVASGNDMVLESEYDSFEVEPAGEIAPTLSAETLFGDFEEEEVVPVGSVYQDQATTIQEAAELSLSEQPVAELAEPNQSSSEPKIEAPQYSVEAFENRIESNDEITEGPTSELEEILHQQIVGISQMTDLVLCESTGDMMMEDVAVEDASTPHDVEATPDFIVDEEPSEPTATDEEQPLSDPEERVEDFIPVTEQTDREVAVEDAEVSPVLWVTESEDTSQDVNQDIQISRDDSDILVIEDELEMRRVDPAARRDAKNKTISVDFQAMLARMRSGSK